MRIFGTRLPFDPELRPFALPPLILAILGYLLAWPWLWVPMLIVLVVFLAFFRDPPRRIPHLPGAVVSPADGKITDIYTNDNPEAGPVGGPCISIFLSVLDVHVNRAPYNGVITSTRVRPGIYRDARDPRCAQENRAVWVFMDCGRFPMTIRLIAGRIARQIICRVREGDEVRRGEHIGMIRFGSRTELFLPPEARVQVEVGQVVRGASTVLAYLPEEG